MFSPRLWQEELGTPAATKKPSSDVGLEGSCPICRADFHGCSEMAFADFMFGLPFEYLVLSSRAIPVLLTRRWMPWDSCLSVSLTRHLMSSWWCLLEDCNDMSKSNSALGLRLGPRAHLRKYLAWARVIFFRCGLKSLLTTTSNVYFGTIGNQHLGYHQSNTGATPSDDSKIIRNVKQLVDLKVFILCSAGSHCARNDGERLNKKQRNESVPSYELLHICCNVKQDFCGAVIALKVL